MCVLSLRIRLYCKWLFSPPFSTLPSTLLLLLLCFFTHQSVRYVFGCFFFFWSNAKCPFAGISIDSIHLTMHSKRLMFQFLCLFGTRGIRFKNASKMELECNCCSIAVSLYGRWYTSNRISRSHMPSGTHSLVIAKASILAALLESTGCWEICVAYHTTFCTTKKAPKSYTFTDLLKRPLMHQ